MDTKLYTIHLQLQKTRHIYTHTTANLDLEDDWIKRCVDTATANERPCVKMQMMLENISCDR